MYAPRATEVDSKTSADPKRITSSSSSAFASALRDGLSDLAYSFDGVFRPTGAMSLAERASYGLWQLVQSPRVGAASSQSHVHLTSDPSFKPMCASLTPNEYQKPAKREVFRSAVKRIVSTGETVRREAKPRRASTPDLKPVARLGLAARYRRARVRATVGSEKVDLIVYSAGRLASVMPWTR
jgi:hypothetical protein